MVLTVIRPFPENVLARKSVRYIACPLCTGLTVIMKLSLRKVLMTFLDGVKFLFQKMASV